MTGRYIVIHRARRRLELYEGNKVVASYPIAIGKKETPTPVGHYSIVNKYINPGGVFGSRWLGLSIPNYGIHGTNNPNSIGTEASKGCIRLHNHHIEQLYNLVSVGTPVIIKP